MRTIVFFDLPIDSVEEKRQYAQFRKFLIKDGFLMLQYSVYTKLCANKSVAQSVYSRLCANKPKQGHVAVLTITEKQFADIQFILGEKKSNVLDTTDRLTIFEDDYE